MKLPLFSSSSPRYAERGVTLSASTVAYTDEWMHALLDQMAMMRLNTLLWEVKISGAKDWPQTDQPFVTPQEAQSIVHYAADRGITVIPEVNAPGHMRTWLSEYPEYAITDATGEKDLERLDVTNEQAKSWYWNLIEKYCSIFTADEWHMGADEFENKLDNRTYADYPDLAHWAVDMYGSQAKPWDPITAFINETNAFLNGCGKKLRIWNDGQRSGGVVPLDSDITVEYWLDKGIEGGYYTPQQFAQMGHSLVNVPQYLYFSRSEKHIYDPQPQEIFEGVRKHLDLFDGDQSLLNFEACRGVRFSLWPDRAECQTPAEVLREARDILILLGQIAWDGEISHTTWKEFKFYADSLDLPPIPNDEEEVYTLNSCEQRKKNYGDEDE